MRRRRASIGVTVQGKSGRFAILADVVIDATGDGDVFAAAGARFELEKVLPWLWFRMGGVEDPQAALDAGGWFFRTVGDGQMLMPWGATERIIRKIDATDPADLTLAELECRKMVMQEVDRLRAEVPQFRHAHLCDIATQLGITESRRLVGEYVLRREDMDRPFDDAIGITGHWTRYGARYWIPYRSCWCASSTTCSPPGRCISVDHRTHHATKEIPACMVTGQAAGTAAALAVQAGIGPKQLDVGAPARYLAAGRRDPVARDAASAMATHRIQAPPERPRLRGQPRSACRALVAELRERLAAAQPAGRRRRARGTPSAASCCRASASRRCSIRAPPFSSSRRWPPTGCTTATRRRRASSPASARSRAGRR